MNKKMSHLTIVVNMCTRVTEVTSHCVIGRDRKGICVEGCGIIWCQFLTKTETVFQR